MTVFRRVGERGRRYDFAGPRCIQATCWAPAEYDIRGASSGGSRNTGRSVTCCIRRAHHGCPMTIVYEPPLAQLRRKEGWRLA